MKYYGIRRKKRRERFIYWYAKYSIKIKGTLPCKHHKYFKQSYNYTFREVNFFTHKNNEIPKGHWFRLNQIVTSDLILRENIGELQKGIRTENIELAIDLLILTLIVLKRYAEQLMRWILAYCNGTTAMIVEFLNFRVKI